MTEKDVKDMLLQLNLVNAQYCDLYDDFFSQKMGVAYDYNLKLSQLFRIQCLLENSNVNLIIFENSFSNTKSQPPILATIKSYIENRRQSMRGFRTVLQALKEKANGKLFRYSFFKYRKDVHMLERLESNALIIGNHLQNYFDQHFL